MNSLIAVPGSRSRAREARLTGGTAIIARECRTVESLPTPDHARLADEATAAHVALGLIDGKWTVDILLAMRDRPLRFGSLSRELAHVARKVLTQTLRCMQRNGLIWRRTSGIVGKPVEYGLTPLGASLLQCVAGFAQWSNRHADAVEASRALFDASTMQQPTRTG